MNHQKYLFIWSISSVFFFIDILFNFNTLYIDKDKTYIRSRSKIACRYLKSWFFIDFLSAFPFSMIGDSKFTGICNTSKFLKIFRLLRLFKFATNYSKDKKKPINRYLMSLKNNFSKLILHIILILIMSHLFACLFYGLPLLIYPTRNWILTNNIQNVSPLTKYLRTMHWIIQTIITVGYGENKIQ